MIRLGKIKHMSFRIFRRLRLYNPSSTSSLPLSPVIWEDDKTWNDTTTWED